MYYIIFIYCEKYSIIYIYIYILAGLGLCSA